MNTTRQHGTAMRQNQRLRESAAHMQSKKNRASHGPQGTALEGP